MADIELEMQQEGPDAVGRDIATGAVDEFREEKAVEPEVISTERPTDQQLFDAINDEELGKYIIQKLENDISDRESSGWQAKREYDYRSYYGLKRLTNWPWKNASNFPVPLTPTLVDTAHANIMASIFADQRNTTEVEGVGPEDVRGAVLVKQVLNWQIYTEIDLYGAFDKLTMNALRTSVGVAKVLNDPFTNKIDVGVVPYHRILKPIDSIGYQKESADHVIELIEWNDADMEGHKNLGLFKNLDSVQKGFKLRQSSTEDSITANMDIVSGSDLAGKKSRDNYFIGEAYLTYYVEWTDGKKYPVEIIVWIAPNGGAILYKAMDEIGKRPYADAIPYPFDDRDGGQSLPEKIRFIQEELDYAHNQNINAGDIAMRPPIFKEGGTNFPTDAYETMPGGVYDVDNAQGIQFQPTQGVNPIFERQEEKYWELARGLTGLTEVFEGRQPSVAQTATATVRQENKAEVRFKALYQRFEKCWGEIISLIYLYDKKYMPDDKKIRIIGYQDYKSIKEIFPDGMEGNYNFTFHSEPITEKIEKKRNIEQWRDRMMTNPLIANDRGALWKIDNLYSISMGIKNFDTIVPRPAEASIVSADDAIQRILNGDFALMPDVNAPAEEQIIRFAFFVRSDAFKSQTPEIQNAIVIYGRRLDQIRQGQMRAIIQAKQAKAQSRGNEGETPVNPEEKEAEVVNGQV